MSSQELRSIIYEPNANNTSSFLSITAIIKDIGPAHELAIRLFKRDIKAQYRQSFFGLIWLIIPPLLTAGLWIFLNSANVINLRNTDIPYPLFVMIGTILWQVFAESVNQPLHSVQSNRSIFTKINFPREALLLAGFYSIQFNLLPKLLVLALAFYFFKLEPGISLFYFPLGVFAISLIGFTIGVLLTPIGLLLDDVARGIGVILPFAMYLTPVIYPAPTNGYASLLMQFNPLATLINTTRDWLTGHLVYIPNEFSMLAGFTLLFLLIGMLTYRISMPIITERLGG
jgi:lipopolysaccharide transport system permease protein